VGENNNNIDLQKLSQKELLIVTYRKVEELASDMKEVNCKVDRHEVRLAVVESRVMMWGAIFGAVAAILTQLISSIID